MKLNQLPVGERGIIAAINVHGPVRRRLFDLGFVPGTVVENVRRSPAGGLNAYLIRDTLIALREEASERILIIRG
ncbi:MAG: ferrous iron transport protein A [Syntrophomonadaceae bacterium]|nr:ferrous iron transport protein A [Syntrophomonadaceae bacterium]